MNTVPTISFLTDLSKRKIKPATRVTTVAGYNMSAPNGTLSKKGFIATYSMVTYADTETMDDFLDANQGASVYLLSLDPGESTTYTVIFDQDEIKWDRVPKSINRWQTQIAFLEV